MYDIAIICQETCHTVQKQESVSQRFKLYECKKHVSALCFCLVSLLSVLWFSSAWWHILGDRHCLVGVLVQYKSTISSDRHTDAAWAHKVQLCQGNTVAEEVRGEMAGSLSTYSSSRLMFWTKSMLTAHIQWLLRCISCIYCWLFDVLFTDTCIPSIYELQCKQIG